MVIRFLVVDRVPRIHKIGDRIKLNDIFRLSHESV